MATAQGDDGIGSRRSVAGRMVLPTLLVLAVTLLLYGWPVPRLSEELYLPLVRRTADASYLRGDWTFAGNFSEHWVFDHLFAPFAGVLSVNAFGWLGRLVFWPVLGVLLIRLGTRFGIGVWTAAGAVCLWLLSNQALFGGEWILGTFEAKTVAYVCFLGALLAITARKIPLGLALLGLTVTLPPRGRPLVGVRGRHRAARGGRDPAYSAALVLARDPARGRPGSSRRSARSAKASDAIQRFVVLESIPYHTDPFFDGRTLVGAQLALHLAVIAAMLAFNLWSYVKAEHSTDPAVLLLRSRSRPRCRSCSRSPPARSTSGSTCDSCRCGRSRSSSRSSSSSRRSAAARRVAVEGQTEPPASGARARSATPRSS